MTKRIASTNNRLFQHRVSTGLPVFPFPKFARDRVRIHERREVT